MNEWMWILPLMGALGAVAAASAAWKAAKET